MFKLNAKSGADSLLYTSVILNATATQCTRSLSSIYRPPWRVQWSHHCSHVHIPIHSPWLPRYIDVAQTVLTVLTMARLFPDRPCLVTMTRFLSLGLSGGVNQAMYAGMLYKWTRSSPCRLAGQEAAVDPGSGLCMASMWLVLGYMKSRSWSVTAFMATLHRTCSRSPTYISTKFTCIDSPRNLYLLVAPYFCSILFMPRGMNCSVNRHFGCFWSLLF